MEYWFCAGISIKQAATFNAVWTMAGGKDEKSFIIRWSIHGGVYHTTLRFFG
jgi:hypothetical protein